MLDATIATNKRRFAEPQRVIKNTRWISARELKMGMYVRELDCPWEDTRFMFQGFEITNLKLLAELKAVCEYVCVESQKVARISTTGGHRLCAATRNRTH